VPSRLRYWKGFPMEESYIFGLLDDLADLIDQGKASFGNAQRRTIDANRALDIIDEIRDTLPRELVDARRIVHTRDDILAAADQEANRIIDDAEKQAATIASEQEIVRLAEQERDRVLADAQEKELDLRYGAYKYTDDVFAQLENNLNKLLDNVARCRQSLNENHQP